MKTFTIVSSRDQKKYVIETEATTMAELTADMDAANIDYNGMTLYEGLTKAEYDPTKTDAILPHDVPYKGNVTSNLVFMLTLPQKKIKSGTFSRQECYELCKNHPNIAEAIKARFNRPYTAVSTTDLNDALSTWQSTPTTEEPVKTPKDNTTVLTEALTSLIEVLLDEDVVYYTDVKDILRNLNGDKTEGGTSPYTDEEVDNMFADL